MSDKVDISLTNGQTIRATVDEMARSARHPKAMLVYFALFCLVVMTAAFPTSLPFPLWVKTAVFLPSIAFAVVIWLAAFAGMVYLQRGSQTVRVFTLIASAIAAIGSQQLSYRLAMLYHIPLPAGAAAQIGLYLFNIILCELSAIAICSFVLRDTVLKRRGAIDRITETPVPTATMDITSDSQSDLTIRIDKTDLPFADIRIASAEGNYLDILHDGGKKLSNMNISDFSDIMPKNMGTRIHRSHWIAFREIAAIRKSGRKVVITAHSGMVIPIARGRQKEVLQEYADWRDRHPT